MDQPTSAGPASTPITSTAHLSQSMAASWAPGSYDTNWFKSTQVAPNSYPLENPAAMLNRPPCYYMQQGQQRPPNASAYGQYYQPDWSMNQNQSGPSTQGNFYSNMDPGFMANQRSSGFADVSQTCVSSQAQNQQNLQSSPIETDLQNAAYGAYPYGTCPNPSMDPTFAQKQYQPQGGYLGTNSQNQQYMQQGPQVQQFPFAQFPRPLFPQNPCQSGPIQSQVPMIDPTMVNFLQLLPALSVLHKEMQPKDELEKQAAIEKELRGKYFQEFEEQRKLDKSVKGRCIKAKLEQQMKDLSE